MVWMETEREGGAHGPKCSDHGEGLALGRAQAASTHRGAWVDKEVLAGGCLLLCSEASAPASPGRTSHHAAGGSSSQHQPSAPGPLTECLAAPSRVVLTRR